jgi:ATP-dependent DNA ligase
VSNKDWDLISYNQAREFDYQFGSKEIIDYVNDANTKPNPNTITTMSISRIFEAIRREPSKNKKIAILEKNIDNELLKKVLLYTYDPLRNYYIKKFDTCDIDQPSYAPLDVIFPVLDALSKREYTGKLALDYLEDTYLAVDVFGRQIIRNIIDRSQHLGIDSKSINKVFLNLIPSIPYMRCSLSDKIDKIQYPGICQRKADGAFVNVVIKDNNIKFFTRNGNEYSLTCIQNELEQLNLNRDVVIHGELLCINHDNSEKSRKEGNGLINSLIKREQTLETLQQKLNTFQGTSKSQKIATEIQEKEKEYKTTDSNLKLIVWDVVDYSDWIAGESNTPYSERMTLLEDYVTEHVKIIDGIYVDSVDEALDYYKLQLSQAYEGAVLKNLNMPWKNGTSVNQIKLKKGSDDGQCECELKVVDVKEGTNKYTGGLGALICSSSDGKVLVSVGGGFSNEERGFKRVDENNSALGIELIEEYDINSYLGKIVTVRFNELITSQSKDTYSLFLPRYITTREDKDSCDDFEYIKSL